jgi:hypothetical protein
MNTSISDMLLAANGVASQAIELRPVTAVWDVDSHPGGERRQRSRPRRVETFWLRALLEGSRLLAAHGRAFVQAPG